MIDEHCNYRPRLMKQQNIRYANSKKHVCLLLKVFSYLYAFAGTTHQFYPATHVTENYSRSCTDPCSSESSEEHRCFILPQIQSLALIL